MKQEFLDYEQHLEMFMLAGGDAHARHLYGEPQKPEGYDEYKKQQEEISRIQREGKTITHDVKKVIPDVEITGYEFDKDGIPKYLTADDVYMGNINPVWEKKNIKPLEYIRKEVIVNTEKPEKEGFDYDEDGIPAYLNAHDRHEGNVNPEWLAKHGNNK